MTEEKRIRLYANHLALTVRRCGKLLELRERYGDNGYSKAKIGTYRSWKAVERAIVRYGDQQLVELGLAAAPKRRKEK
jgi:hypothetical protein